MSFKRHYRKTSSGSTQLVSLRLESDVIKLLRDEYHVNLNAQVNHLLSNLLTELILYSDKRVFVYTK